MTVTIVGLGPGDIDNLSLKAWRLFEKADHVFLRTSQHPCVPDLPSNPTYESFDEIYNSADDFAHVYDAIVERIVINAQERDVIYAVPGDPYVGESTTGRIVQRCQALSIPVKIVHGVSFIEPMMALVGLDAMDSLQIFDGIDIASMHHPPINPEFPALIGQVYSRSVASNVKLTLMNQYPDEFEVVLIHSAGNTDANIERLPLYEIDRSEYIAHLTSLFVPALGEMTSFERFQEIIAHLRAPEGCPWDRKQTHESLRPYLIEEAYEVLDAIDSGDTDELYGELGDLLLQIVLHTQIAIDDGEFYMTDVLRHVNEKMIRRHPHVWGDVNAENPDQVVTNWEAIKQQEKNQNGKQAQTSLLDSIPASLPSLLQAHKYQAKAAKVGFDWHEIDDVKAKINEELQEIFDAETLEDKIDEFGDLLFVLVNWGRWLGIDDPETALRMTNRKFYRRFSYIEAKIAQTEREIDTYTLEELDALWNQAKAEGL